MYQSFHLSPHYPGTGDVEEIGVGKGEGYNVNAPLSFGNGDNAITKLMENVFLPITYQYKPHLIIISCGFDSHHSDPLGGLKLTANCYGQIIAKFQEIQPKIVCTLEGGYNLHWIGKCVLTQIAQLSSNKISVNDSVVEYENVKTIIELLHHELGRFWQI